MDAVSLSISPAAIPVAASSNTGPAPVTAVQVDASASTSATEDTTWSPKNFAKNVDQFKSVTSTLLDTSGKYSYDEQLTAYSSLYEMAAKGKLAGMASDDEKLFTKALSESSVGINAARIYEQLNVAHSAARARGEDSGVAKLKFIAGLSEVDQKTHFAVTDNGFDLGGNRQFTDIDSWRNQLVANATQSDPIGLGQALKGVDSKALGSSWNAQILSLFSSNKVAASGSSATSPVNPASVNPKLPLSYQPGNVINQLA